MDVWIVSSICDVKLTPLSEGSPITGLEEDGFSISSLGTCCKLVNREFRHAF